MSKWCIFVEKILHVVKVYARDVGSREKKGMQMEVPWKWMSSTLLVLERF